MEDLIQTEWVVITGSPYSGKTSLLSYLALRGFRVFPEAARVMTDCCISEGWTVEKIRENERKFQLRVLEIKESLEDTLSPTEMIFLDRGILDTHGFFEASDFSLKGIRNRRGKFRYRDIFVLDPLPQYQLDYARAEDTNKAAELNNILFNVYMSYGYHPTRIPVKSIKQRAIMLLQYIEERKTTSRG